MTQTSNWVTRKERENLKKEILAWKDEGRTHNWVVAELATRGIDAWYSVCAARLGYTPAMIVYHKNETEMEDDITIIGEWK